MTRGLAAALAGAIALAFAACGDEDPALPGACTGDPGGIAQALTEAPGAVKLSDGTRLSTCVHRARSDGELQTVGASFTRVARDLAPGVKRNDAAALQLGYLVGATRRGARGTGGIHEELVRRLDQTVGLDGVPPHRRAAFERGLAAGRRNG